MLAVKGLIDTVQTSPTRLSRARASGARDRSDRDNFPSARGARTIISLARARSADSRALNDDDDRVVMPDAILRWNPTVATAARRARENWGAERREDARDSVYQRVGISKWTRVLHVARVNIIHAQRRPIRRSARQGLHLLIHVHGMRMNH